MITNTEDGKTSVTKLELSVNDARRMKSCLDRLKVTLAEIGESFGELQPKAYSLGEQLNIEKWAMDLFSEEVVRGTLFSSLSNIMKKLDKEVRESAQLGDWLIVS